MRKTMRLKNIIDIEASGLSNASYPIEVGIVLDGGDKYQSLIQPLSDWTHWDPDAEKLHGINLNELHENGRSIFTVCNEINEFCYGKTLYSDCWVYDNTWINLLFCRAGISKTFFCSPFESVLDEKHLDNYLKTKIAVEAMAESPIHRALQDALNIQQAIFLLENNVRMDYNLLRARYANENDEQFFVATAN